MTYARLCSVRHQTKATNNLINAITAKFGEAVRVEEHFSMIDRKGKYAIWFKLHGNKYADWVELWSADMEVVKQIREVFPEDFRGEIQIREGEA